MFCRIRGTYSLGDFRLPKKTKTFFEKTKTFFKKG